MDRYTPDRCYILQILSTASRWRGAWIRFWIGFHWFALAQETDGRTIFPWRWKNYRLSVPDRWFSESRKRRGTRIQKVYVYDKIFEFWRVDSVRRDQIRFKVTHEVYTYLELFINICESQNVFAGCNPCTPQSGMCKFKKDSRVKQWRL